MISGLFGEKRNKKHVQRGMEDVGREGGKDQCDGLGDALGTFCCY